MITFLIKIPVCATWFCVISISLLKRFHFRKELREIKDSKETKILLDCSFNILQEVLFQAQQVGLMGSEHSFIIASLVSRNISEFNRSNIIHRHLGYAHLELGAV